MSKYSEYDTIWESIIETFFSHFIGFISPQAYAEIDWQHGFEFLDKELASITPKSEIKHRLDGAESWLLIYIEVQSQPDADFEQRMFTYHYRIFDMYKKDVVSFAILADELIYWHPHQYQKGRWNCEVIF